MNYEFNGTPGEWKVDALTNVSGEHQPIADIVKGEWGDSYPAIKIEGTSLSHIAKPIMERIVYGEVDKTEALANAHLIAASPQLLQACIAMTNYCNKHNVIELVPEYEQMIAAIRKALNIQP